MSEDSPIVQHLRSGQDRLARIGEAVSAFRRLSPSDYGHFLATIETDLGVGVPELAVASAQLLLAAPPQAGPPQDPSTTASVRSGSLREAVLMLLADGRPRSTVEIRTELEAHRPVKRDVLNTEVFSMRKLGLLRSEGQGRGRKHSLAPSASPSKAARRARTPRAARPKREADSDDDRPRRSSDDEPSRQASVDERPRRSSEGGRRADAEQIYAAAIGGHELLTGREELELARRLEQAEVAIWKRLLVGPLASEARRLLAELDPPVSGRCGAAAARAADLDRQVVLRVVMEAADPAITRELRGLLAEADRLRERFVACNLRLVPSTIRRHGYHLTTNLSMGDLIQEGNFGLLKAIPRFDHRRGLRFSTFATWWIRHYLVRARQNLGAEVRVPVHLHDLASKVRRARVQLRAELGHDPSQAEIAAALKVSKKSLKTLEGAWLKHRESLPTFDSVGEDGETPSYLASDEALADEILDRHRDDSRIAAAVSRMSPLLAQIVRRRFGLDGSESETLKEIGASMKLSRERIRQLEVKALTILRRLLSEDGDEIAAAA